MTETAHDHARPGTLSTPLTREADLAPGRASRSSSMDAPTHPVVSGLIARKAERDSNGVAAGADQAIAMASSSSGMALPTTIMRKFESSLGTDLSGVRVHTGAESQTAASAVGAKAYTMGQDIHFGAGHYDPSSSGGEHLLAHEVAHTVQQRGGSPTRQNKLEVSSPHDGAEHEADRAADAMVSGAPTTVGSAAHRVDRKTETEVDADEGEKTAMAGAASNLTLQVSNATDVGDASKMLGMLLANQVLVEKGVAMASPQQESLTDMVEDAIHLKKFQKPQQIPLEAITVNNSVITDLREYLVVSGGQTLQTNDFQQQYKALLASYGRVDGIAKNYCGTALQNIKPGGERNLVSDGAGAGGHTTDQLAATFQELMKDPDVRAARENVASSTSALEKMPAAVNSASLTATASLQTFQSSAITVMIAHGGVESLALKTKMTEAKAKAEQANQLTDKAKQLVMGFGKDAGKDAAKAVVGAGALTAGKVAAIAGEAAESAGIAAGWSIADSVFIDPAKAILGQAIVNADAAVGVVSEEAVIDANLDKATTQQDSATFESFKASVIAWGLASQSVTGTFDQWTRAAQDFELQKLTVKNNFAALETAMQKSATAHGKRGEGKALAEMAGFLDETEQFVVQADLVIATGTNGLGAKADQIPQQARTALEKIRNRSVWMAHSYPFTTAKGDTVEYYGAQEVTVHIVGPGLDASPADLAGKGRADGFNADPNANTQASNNVVGDAVNGVRAMRDRVAAVRAQIMSRVFGSTMA